MSREWNRAFYKTFKDPEVLDQTDNVERTGYRSIADQVKPLLQAGVKLANYRKGLYQYQGDEDDEQPVMSMQSDVFSVMENSRKVESNMQKTIKTQQEKLLDMEKEKLGREWALKNSPPSAEEPTIKP